jgi:DNA-binding MarR family transcriptional regulator
MNALRRKAQEILKSHGEVGFLKFCDEQGLDPDSLGISYKVSVTYNFKTNWKKGHAFIKLFKVEMGKLMKNKETFNIEVLGFITLLTQYLGYEDNILYNDKNDYLNQSDIMDLTGWSRRRVSNMINLLIDNEVIYQYPHEKDKRKHKYYFNPNIAFKGSEIDVEAFRFFNKK